MIRLISMTAIAALIAAALPGVSNAQLIDPNQRCYYPPGSTQCVPYPAAPPAPAPASPVVNRCEADCQGRQQQCMRTCTAEHDWYRCFAYCGDVRTTCLRGCPM